MMNKLLIKNAKVYNDDCNYFQYTDILVSNGKVVDMQANIEDKQAFVINADKRFICKAFCDYHLHVPGAWLFNLFGVNLSKTDSLEEYEKIIKCAADKYEIIKGFGWSIEKLKTWFYSSNYTPRQFLDIISNERPIILFSNDFHSCWCNSRALELMSLEKIACEHFDNSVFSEEEGILHEGIAKKFFDSSICEFSKDEITAAFLRFQKQLLSVGVCEVYSYMFIGVKKIKMLEILTELEKRGELIITVNVCIDFEPNEDISHLYLKIKEAECYVTEHILVKTLKVYVDGVIDNHSAALRQHYSDGHKNGHLLWKKEKLKQVCELTNQYGLSIHAHAIGDMAVSFIIDCLESAKKNANNTITHMQLCELEDIIRMKQLGIVACLQPFWFYRGQNAERVDQVRLGNRVDTQYRAKSFYKNDVKVVFSSDCPVTENLNPIIGILKAIDDDCSGEAVSVKEAVSSFTVGHLNPKWQMAIDIGSDANFVILSNDLFSEEKNQKYQVDYTIVFGKSFKVGTA